MKNLIVILIFLPFAAFSQINDTWDAVKVGTADMSKIYVGSDLVWQKPATEVAYEGTSGASFTTSSNTISVPYPSIVNSGDILIFALSYKWTNSASFTLSNWTQLSSDTEVSTSPYLRVFVYYKIANGTEDGTNLTINFSNTLSSIGGVIYRFSANTTNIPPYSATSTTNIVHQVAAETNVTSVNSGDMGVKIEQILSNTTSNYTGNGWTQVTEGDAASGLKFSMYYYPFTSDSQTSSVINSPNYNSWFAHTYLVINRK